MGRRGGMRPEGIRSSTQRPCDKCKLVFGPFACLHVRDHPHKSIIHVQLMMTVEEGGTRVVRYKIHLNALIGFQVDYIFHDARCPSIPYLYNLKTKPVQMHRVRLIALVQERQSVPLSMF